MYGTLKNEIYYVRGNSNEISLTVFVDANSGGDLTPRRSTYGILVILCGALVIFYKSKRQRTVALSSSEAEYMALYLAAQETIWLR